ncbi:MAG TPA: DUF2079 domain-containing protein [Patescibacteria group bacterium]|nr:DUF2079 domain-containing protein [Patescibacteria group bacterium]
MKKNAFIPIIVFSLFILFPFWYVIFLISNKYQLLNNPTAVYPITIALSLFLALFIDRVTNNKLSPDAKRIIQVIFSFSIISYAVYLFLITWERYVNFISEAIDLVFFHQVIWQFSEFKIPYIWNLNQPLYPQWSQHFSPILALLAPLYWIAHSEGLLLSTQAIATLSGAIPIYLISKEYLHSKSIGLSLAFAYLSFGGLQFGFAYGFHEILFFPPLFLWSYYFYTSKNKKFYYLFIALSLLVKEEVVFIVFFWGLYLYFVKRDRQTAIITMAMGALWGLICFEIIFPIFNNGHGFGYWGQYESFLSPAIVTNLFNTQVKIDMFLETFGQFSFLLFLFPPAVIIVIPSLLEKLLSSGIAQANGAHYSAAIAAVTVVATIEALSRIDKYKFVKKHVRQTSIFFAVLIFYFAMFSNVFFGYNGYSLIPAVQEYDQAKGPGAENSQILDTLITQIPLNAKVSAQYQIAPHLNKYYKDLTIWPSMTGTEDFVIIDTKLPPVLGATSDDYNRAIDKMNTNKKYTLAFSSDGILAYRRNGYKLN